MANRFPGARASEYRMAPTTMRLAGCAGRRCGEYPGRSETIQYENRLQDKAGLQVQFLFLDVPSGRIRHDDRPWGVVVVHGQLSMDIGLEIELHLFQERQNGWSVWSLNNQAEQAMSMHRRSMFSLSKSWRTSRICSPSNGGLVASFWRKSQWSRGCGRPAASSFGLSRWAALTGSEE